MAEKERERAEVRPLRGFDPGLPPETIPAPPDPGPDGVRMLKTVLGIVAARSIAFIALLGAVAVWLWAAFDPTLFRLYAGVGVSLTVLVPALILYGRQG